MSEGGMVLAVWLAGSGVTLFGLMAWEPTDDPGEFLGAATVSLLWPLLIATAIFIAGPLLLVAYAGTCFGRWVRRRRHSRAESTP